MAKTSTKVDEQWYWPPGDKCHELQRAGIQAYAEVHRLSWDDAARRLGQISLRRQAEINEALS
jgi:hypothetical protein